MVAIRKTARKIWEDAADYGVDPAAPAAENTGNLQIAIDRVWNDHGGGVLQIQRKSGVYQVDHTALIVRPNVEVRSNGAVLHMASEPASALSVFTHDPANGSDGAAIEGLELRGPSYGLPVAASGLAYGIWVRDGAGITLRKNKVEGFTSDGIRLDGNVSTDDPSKVRIERNWVKNCYRGIFAIHGVQDLQILGNILEEMGFASLVVDDLSGGGSYGPRPARVIVSKNICRDWARVSSTSAILVSAAAGSVLTDNFLEGVGNPGEIGIVASTGGNTAVGIQEAAGPVISGNVFKNIRGTSLSLQGVNAANVGVNSYINPGLGSGGIGSVAVSLARSLAPDDPGDSSTERNCRNCKVAGQVIFYESDIADELAVGIQIADADQVDNELLFNTVLAGTTRISDGGTDTLKVGNKTTDTGTPRHKVESLAEFTSYIHLTRNAAQIYYDRPNGAAGQYSGITWRQLDGAGVATDAIRLWYDYTNDQIVVFDNASGMVFAVQGNGRIRTNQTQAGSTLGSVTGQMPIYDPAGALVGYVPLYDSIT